jgi:hypothetical protein
MNAFLRDTASVAVAHSNCSRHHLNSLAHLALEMKACLRSLTAGVAVT